MSLYDEYTELCVKTDVVFTPDGYGGSNVQTQSGESFMCAIVVGSSNTDDVAGRERPDVLYRVTAPKDVSLTFHSVFTRVRDGQMFRVITRDKVATPNSSTLDMQQVDAEEWNPLNGGV